MYNVYRQSEENRVSEIIVVGCGVNGLTCGIKLLEKYSVKIVANRMPPGTTSDAAGAFWYPYKVNPPKRALKWSNVSLDEFYRLAAIDGTGVSIVTLLEISREQIDPPFWKSAARNFRAAEIEELPAGYSCGYAIELPKVETPIYMPYLMHRFSEAGGTVEVLNQPMKALSELYEDDRIIVNCTGLGARDLCSDPDVFPIRGQVTRLRTHSVKQFLLDEGGPTLVLPRTNDCIIGTTAQENDWNLRSNHDDANDIFRRCSQLVPDFHKAEVIEHKVGLRPGRTEVRLEVERISSSCSVIHNYGHGGAGFTLSWGCAQDVSEHVGQLMEQIQTSPNRA